MPGKDNGQKGEAESVLNTLKLIIKYPGLNSIDDVVKRASAVSGLSTSDIRGESRERRVNLVRQTAWYVMKKLHGDPSFASIGRVLGQRNHSTVLHGIRKVGRIVDTYGAEHGITEESFRNLSLPEIGERADEKFSEEGPGMARKIADSIRGGVVLEKVLLDPDVDPDVVVTVSPLGKRKLPYLLPDRTSVIDTGETIANIDLIKTVGARPPGFIFSGVRKKSQDLVVSAARKHRDDEGRRYSYYIQGEYLQ